MQRRFTILAHGGDRTTAYGVADEEFSAREPRLCNAAIEHVARAPDEVLLLRLLPLAGCFTDERDVRVRRAFTGETLHERRTPDPTGATAQRRALEESPRAHRSSVEIIRQVRRKRRSWRGV